ncbi:MAG: glycosyltransferase family 2 protein [Prevotella sp.]|nr:glycosyltransferase family 2 protein [Prevotella sp.]
MGVAVLHIADWLLWGIMAVSTVYAFVFALASLVPKGGSRPSLPLSGGSPEQLRAPSSSFLVLFPAYREDRVIVHSVETFLRQDYPKDSFLLCVISDHMEPATNERLAQLPVVLLTPDFERSSKAKALQYAIEKVENGEQTGRRFDYVVILDADNLVGEDFLTRLNGVCNDGYQAIQCHRTAKNADNGIAALDGASEETNNSIFRRGHNRLGLSSALIGSGMCFSYLWFSRHVGHLSSAVEDRELEALLMRQGIYIHYAEDIYVMDEKVSSSDNFQRQRLRWMTGQIQTLLLMLPHVPKAMLQGNINYLDKTFQQALIPRSLLLVFIVLFSAIMVVAAPARSVKWLMLLGLLVVTLLVAIPRRMRNRRLLVRALAFPRLAWHMVSNLLHIDTNNKEFLHTTHGENV